MIRVKGLRVRVRVRVMIMVRVRVSSLTETCHLG